MGTLQRDRWPIGTMRSIPNHVHPAPMKMKQTSTCCNAPEWRRKLLQRIVLSGVGQDQDPVLIDLLRDGVHRWLKDDPPPPLSSYPHKYSQLILDQSQIGWAQLFRGRWAKEWYSLERSHLQRRDNINGMTTKMWVDRMGTTLIQAWLDVWKIRVKDRHGKDEEDQKEKRKAHLLAQLEELYTMKTKVLPAHRHLFLEDAASHLEQTRVLDSLEDWINTFRPAILSSVQKAQSIIHRMWRHHR